MRSIRMSYELAMACMRDTANRSMREGGREHWNEEDYNAGVRELARLLPLAMNLSDKMGEEL